MPYTWLAMIVGTLALTGFPLSGYYSKDAIIEYAYLSGNSIGILQLHWYYHCLSQLYILGD